MVTRVEIPGSEIVPSTSPDSSEDEVTKPTPLPKAQLLSISLIQVAEPLTGSVIYPFINQLVRETGITGGDEKKTGYYAGIIESAFFFSECATCVQWGYLSDRYGRRPIFLCAPLGLTISMLLFGSSTTFRSLVVSRCLQGLFNGNMGMDDLVAIFPVLIVASIVVLKSIIAELTDSTNRGDTYALLSVLWNTGLTIGPIFGGFFSNPAEEWPNSLGRIPYLQIHPYFLPCFLAGVFPFAGFIVAFFTLKETLPSKTSSEGFQDTQRAASNDPERAPLIQDDNTTHYDTVMFTPNTPIAKLASVASPVSHAVFTSPVVRTLINSFFLAGLDMCNFALLPLMYSTPLEYGGLGLDPFNIGIILGTFGFLNSFIQAKFLGGLIRQYGARKVYIVNFSALLGCFGMYPILKFLAQKAGGVNSIVFACIVIHQTFRTSISFSYGSQQVILVESVPEGGPLGAVNGFAQMVASGLRGIAPTFASSLFSISLQKGFMSGDMVYYILMAITFVGIQCSFYMPSNSSRN